MIIIYYPLSLCGISVFWIGKNLLFSSFGWCTLVQEKTHFAWKLMAGFSKPQVMFWLNLIVWQRTSTFKSRHGRPELKETLLSLVHFKNGSIFHSLCISLIWHKETDTYVSCSLSTSRKALVCMIIWLCVKTAGAMLYGTYITQLPF